MHFSILLLCSFLMAHPATTNKQDLEKEILSILHNQQATVGVAVIENNQTVVSINDKKHYPMQSVYKFHLALAVLNHLDKNHLPLSTEIAVSKSDLHPNTYSPLAKERPEGGFKMTVADLIKYSVSLSDNNACDLLFKFVGGPRIVIDYIKSIGIKEIAINDTEASMHEKRERQYRNWTSPTTAARLMEIFTKNQLFANEYQQFLEKILIETSTGNDKIKSLLPPDLILGHKTGNGFREANGVKSADNDLAFIRLPNGRQYTIGVFVMDSKEDDATNAAIIARISKAVYDYMLSR